MAGATAAEERVAEMEVCLQRVENKIIRRLDEAIQNQVLDPWGSQVSLERH